MCEKVDDKLIPFYIGKGEAYRVWDHEAGQEKEINAIKEMYEDYPLHDKIATRTGDYELAKKIYDECEKNSDGSISRVLPFNELSDELREYLKGPFGPLKKNQTYESVYNNLVKRKYYVVEDILDTDPDVGLRELIGRRIIERMIKDDKEIITSPIRPRNYIRYSKK